MNEHLTLGIFAFAVVIISLVRVMGENEFFRLKAMKRCFGRKAGLLLHFLANVGLPLVVGIVFFCRGIAGFTPVSFHPGTEDFHLSVSSLRLELAVAELHTPRPLATPPGADPGQAHPPLQNGLFLSP